MTYYEEKYKERVIRGLTKRAAELGYTLEKNQEVTEGVS